MTGYRDAAAVLWGEAGEYAHDAYTRIRGQHFPGLPPELPIVIGLTAYGHCTGLTRGGWRHGPRISLSSALFARGTRAVDDTLLHEMLHAWLMITGREHAHDSGDWYAHVTRLSPAVLGRPADIRRGAGRKSVRVPNPRWAEGSGQPKTIVRKVRTDAVSHRDVAGWPRSWRPAGYDWGPAIACPAY